MSDKDRAGIFDDDLSDFTPTPPASREQVRDIAEQVGFRSRDPQAAQPPRSIGGDEAPTREPRRYRTGRNRQLNLKVRSEDVDAFYAMADSQGWVLGEAFARAVTALRRELESMQEAP